MNDSQLLQEGLALMGFGMSFVFIFLTVLVIATTLMANIIGRFFLESAPAAPSHPGCVMPDRDDDLMAIITAAIHNYRREYRR